MDFKEWFKWEYPASTTEGFKMEQERAFDAGQKQSAREIMRMVARQKLCHDDEFLLLSSIRDKFGLEI